MSVLAVDRYETTYAESYIFAQKNNPEYEAVYTRDGTTYSYSARQFAIWELKREEYGETNSYIGDNKPVAKKLYEEATEFQSFREEFKLPKLNSNSSDYEFKYNVNGDYFIAGPVIIDYPKLELDSGLVVGKITSSKLYGTNSDGEENKEVPFVIADENGNKIDFPTKGGQFTFYIKVPNSTVKSQKIKEITNYKVNFEYLDARGYGYTVTDPSKQGIEYYQWDQEEDHDDCWIYNSDSDIEYVDCYDGYYDYDYCSDWECYVSHKIHHDASYQLQRRSYPGGHAEVQPIFALGEAELFWRQYELEITFKDKLPTYIDLGGKVWVDNLIDNGKVIDDSNGKYDDGEYGRENVLVELFFFDGTPVKVAPNKVVEDKRNVNLVNPANGAKVAYNNTTFGYAMYTDADGEYMFYGLPVDQKYFVRFTYDGQTYEKVLYLAGGSEADYKNNPNDAKYDNNSKVKDETDRQAFNNRFEKITYANIRARETGKASGTSETLRYIFKAYKEGETSYIKSKIITTDNRRDAEYGEPTEKVEKQTGKVIDPFKLQARTPTSLQYPFEKNGEILIWSAKDNEPLRYLKHINFGLKIRPRADFQLSTQLKAGATTIKDKEKVVIYPQSAKKEDLSIDFTRQEDEYIKQEISAADYNWRAQFENIYGDGLNSIEGYVVDEEKLHVYVLYRIAIKNQCEDANDYGVINEIIDYYDNRLERVRYNDVAIATRLFREAGLKVPVDAGESWIEGTNTEVEWKDSSDTVRNQNNRNITYNIMKSTTPITVNKGNSETAIYLILKVKDNGDVLSTGTEDDRNTNYQTDEGKDGMQNIAEIGSYSVYNNGVNVGKIDKDSAPGNAIPGNKATYEDDTDASPMFRLEINWTPKEIQGIVWDDINKDGINNDGVTGIEGVTVKLVEHIVKNGRVYEVERPGIELRNNTIYVNPKQSIKTRSNGRYSFYVEGGNYSLKFIYGDEDMLQSNKKYNAQDYQATKNARTGEYDALSSGRVPGYNQDDKLKAFATNEDLVAAPNNFLVVGQEGENSELDWWNNNWNIGAIFGSDRGTQSNIETDKWGSNTRSNRYSNARDKADIRADIIENTQELVYHNANVLDKLNGNGGVSRKDAIFLSGGNTAEPRQTYKDNGNYTYMEAVTDIITIASNDLISEPNVINLGLKERPQASRKLEKKVDRIVLTASDGTVLVDTGDNTKQSGLQKLDGIQQTFINLEPGLMDGALLDIYYTLTVTNDSERGSDDCLRNYWYVSNSRDDDTYELNKLARSLNKKYSTSYTLDTLLPIKAEIFDYVNINLEYRADDNKYEKGEIWDRVYEESGNNSVNKIDSKWLSDDTRKGIERTQKKVSKVLQTNTDQVVSKYKGDAITGSATDGLLAGESVNIPIHLGITLSEDTSKMNLMDYDFSNCAEMVQVTTTAGRRDYNTIPGDYVPYDTSEANKKQEDAFLTGTTAITPPLGEGRFYYVIAIVSATIILAGIILIKKKVLKK